MKYTIESMHSWEMQKRKNNGKPYDKGYNDGLHEAIERYYQNEQNAYDKARTIMDLKDMLNECQNDCCNRSQGKADAIKAVLSKIR